LGPLGGIPRLGARRHHRVHDAQPGGVPGQHRASQPLHHRSRWLRPSTAHHLRRSRHSGHAAALDARGSGITFTRVDGPGVGTRRMAYIDADGQGMRSLTPEPGIEGTHPELRPIPVGRDAAPSGQPTPAGAASPTGGSESSS
jgi:hypothetical protein